MATDDTILGDDRPARDRPRVAPSAGLGAANVAPAAAQAAPAPVALEDSRTRAARRAAELREHLGDMDDGEDEFYIDLKCIPDGWSYEWKREEVLGQKNSAYDVSLRRKGWEEVPASRHPDMMPNDYVDGPIRRKGMILMERPLEITTEAREIEARKARAQVRQKEVQLNGSPAGQNSPFDNTNKGSPLVNIRKSYEPLVVADK